MAGDLAHSEVLHFRSRVLANHLVRPQVPNLNQLVSASDNAKVLDPESVVFVSGLAPVNNSGDCVAPCHLRGVNLRMPHESLPS